MLYAVAVPLLCLLVCCVRNWPQCLWPVCPLAACWGAGMGRWGAGCWSTAQAGTGSSGQRRMSTTQQQRQHSRAAIWGNLEKKGACARVQYALMYLLFRQAQQNLICIIHL
ncbi:hypothetical protein COO60DRAFT_1516762 [Scenedesmus sp. NREL 46B-D3]|nr:hypothetical protein COO60DRAFT_1516762 [Scenedesmus sp. NREL 46B-D3]